MLLTLLMARLICSPPACAIAPLYAAAVRPTRRPTRGSGGVLATALAAPTAHGAAPYWALVPAPVPPRSRRSGALGEGGAQYGAPTAAAAAEHCAVPSARL